MISTRTESLYFSSSVSVSSIQIFVHKYLFCCELLEGVWRLSGDVIVFSSLQLHFAAGGLGLVAILCESAFLLTWLFTSDHCHLQFSTGLMVMIETIYFSKKQRHAPHFSQRMMATLTVQNLQRPRMSQLTGQCSSWSAWTSSGGGGGGDERWPLCERRRIRLLATSAYTMCFIVTVDQHT